MAGRFAKDLGAHDYFDGSKVDTAAELQKLGGAALIVVTAPNPGLCILSPKSRFRIRCKDIITVSC